jgi:hypothetical protein
MENQKSEAKRYSVVVLDGKIIRRTDNLDYAKKALYNKDTECVIDGDIFDSVTGKKVNV